MTPWGLSLGGTYSQPLQLFSGAKNEARKCLLACKARGLVPALLLMGSDCLNQALSSLTLFSHCQGFLYDKEGHQSPSTYKMLILFHLLETNQLSRSSKELSRAELLMGGLPEEREESVLVMEVWS